MDIKVILILLSFIFATDGQGYYGVHNGRRRTGRIPARCPAGSPLIRCVRNPCQGNSGSGCPNYPNSVCINDNPCEPWCVGHYYIGRLRRLTRRECHGDIQEEGHENGCPPSRLRCIVNPCQVGTCPAYPNARCVNDPCEPNCIGHFYDGDRQLTTRECHGRNRRRNRYRHRHNS